MVTKRLAVLDLARGLAVVTMAVYHFSWDLSWFAFVDWPVAQGTDWRIFAALIAGSFLFLAGVSLDLAHHDAIRWRPFWRRLGVIVAAAAAVSLATYFTFNDNFVRFGILHCIAAASLIALPFARLPLWMSAAAAAIVLTLPLWASSDIFNGQTWLWTGLGSPEFGSVDYVPLAPWTGVTLAGLAVSRTFRLLRVWQRLSALQLTNPAGRLTRFLGRHSLPVYLLHQPVLYGLVWSAAMLGPEADRAEVIFTRNCSATCQDSLGTPNVCDSVCGCTLSFLKTDNIWAPYKEDPMDPALRARVNSRYAQCLSDPELTPPVISDGD